MVYFYFVGTQAVVRTLVYTTYHHSGRTRCLSASLTDGKSEKPSLEPAAQASSHFVDGESRDELNPRGTMLQYECS